MIKLNENLILINKFLKNNKIYSNKSKQPIAKSINVRDET